MVDFRCIEIAMMVDNQIKAVVFKRRSLPFPWAKINPKWQQCPTLGGYASIVAVFLWVYPSDTIETDRFLCHISYIHDYEMFQNLQIVY